LDFLSFIPELPKGLDQNLLMSVKPFLLHLADFEPGSVLEKRHELMWPEHMPVWATVLQYRESQRQRMERGALCVAFPARCRTSKPTDPGT